ncbi:hypothetical protein V2J09_018411 [Rumex salicifolius]
MARNLITLPSTLFPSKMAYNSASLPQTIFLLTLSSTVGPLLTTSFKFLAPPAIPTSPTPHLINSPLGPSNVSSSDTRQITLATGAWISRPTSNRFHSQSKFSYLPMIFLQSITENQIPYQQTTHANRPLLTFSTTHHHPNNPTSPTPQNVSPVEPTQPQNEPNSPTPQNSPHPSTTSPQLGVSPSSPNSHTSPAQPNSTQADIQLPHHMITRA